MINIASSDNFMCELCELDAGCINLCWIYMYFDRAVQYNVHVEHIKFN